MEIKQQKKPIGGIGQRGQGNGRNGKKTDKIGRNYWEERNDQAKFRDYE